MLGWEEKRMDKCIKHDTMIYEDRMREYMSLIEVWGPIRAWNNMLEYYGRAEAIRISQDALERSWTYRSRDGRLLIDYRRAQEWRRFFTVGATI